MSSSSVGQGYGLADPAAIISWPVIPERHRKPCHPEQAKCAEGSVFFLVRIFAPLRMTAVVITWPPTDWRKDVQLLFIIPLANYKSVCYNDVEIIDYEIHVTFTLERA